MLLQLIMFGRVPRSELPGFYSNPPKSTSRVADIILAEVRVATELPNLCSLLLLLPPVSRVHPNWPCSTLDPSYSSLI